MPALRAPLRRLLGPLLLTLGMLAILVGLGVWQLHRLTWKEGLLTEIARAEAAPPVPLPAHPRPFTKVSVHGRLQSEVTAWYGVSVRNTPQGRAMGADLIEPLDRAGAPPVLVDRGWVPDQPAAPIAEPPGEVTVNGFIRHTERPGWLSAPDDPEARRFFSPDVPVMAAALGLKQVAPFLLIAMGPSEPGQYPAPAQHLPRPLNNHLNYALTWFGLAGALLVIFVLWARKAVRA